MKNRCKKCGRTFIAVI